MGEQQSIPIATDQTKTYLDISNQLLPEAPNLNQFPGLKNLNLSHNQMTSIDSLVTLLNLTKLDVSNNELELIPDLLYINLTHLQDLQVESNQLRVLSPLICFLTSLVNLNLSRNKLEQIPDPISSCHELTLLNISFNSLRNIPPTIIELPQLKALILNNNNINTIPKGIGKCTGLTLLNLGENEMQEVPDYIKTCTNLVKLYLDNNDIRKVTPSISNLVSLKELNLRSNGLQRLPIDLTKLTNLNMCDVGDNQFNDKFFDTEPSITSLFKYLSTHSFVSLTRKVASKTDRRKQSLQTQLKINQSSKKKIFKEDDIYIKKLLLRISENDDFTYCRIVNCKGTEINHNDAYIYDDLKYIYVWIGKKCNDFKKTKAKSVASLLSQEELSEVIYIDYTEQKNVHDTFLNIFNVDSFDENTYDNEELFIQYINSLKTFTFEDNDIEVVVDEVHDEVLTSELLQSSRSLLIDTGIDVFVWCGQYSDNNERNTALLQAESLLSSSGRRKELLNFVLEGNETLIFKEYFHDLAIKDDMVTSNTTDFSDVLRSPSPSSSRSSHIRRTSGSHLRNSGDFSSRSPSPSPLQTPRVLPKEVQEKPLIQEDQKVPEKAPIKDKEELKVTVIGQVIKDETKPIENIETKNVEKKTEHTDNEKHEQTSSFVNQTPITIENNLENKKELKESTQNDKYNIKKDSKKEKESTEPSKGNNELATNQKNLDQIVNEEDTQLIKVPRRTVVKKRAAASKNITQLQKDIGAKTELEEKKQDQPKQISFDDILQQREKFVAKRNQQNIKTEEDYINAANSITGNPLDLPRLFQIKGQKRPFVRQVECTWKSMNSGDAFVYDPGKGTRVIYHWQGKKSNRMEKGKAMDIAKRIKDKERVGCSQLLIEEGKEPEAFWKGLQGPPTHPIPEDDGKIDTEAEVQIIQRICLYWLRYDESTEEVIMEKTVDIKNHISKGLLDVTQCYLLDCENEMFLWLGNKCQVKVRQRINKFVESMYNERKSLGWMAPLYKEYPGGEEVMFKERFYDWNTLPIGSKEDVSSGKGIVYKKSQGMTSEVDFNKMMLPATEKTEVKIDDGKGDTQIWKIDGFNKIEIKPEEKGVLFEAESYIILYHYKIWAKDMYLLYFWQGRSCAVIDKGTSARLTVDFHKTLKSDTKEMRVVQNVETRHFLSMFNNSLIIRQGKYKKEFDYNKKYLFDIRGKEEPFIKAIEVDVQPNALCSYGVFILLTPKTKFIWKGKFRNEKYVEFAVGLGKVHQFMEREQCVEIEEGNESEEFIQAIGGKYEIDQPTHMYVDRLYQLSTTSGALRCEEHVRFYQDDLYSNDVMLLDTVDGLYVWLGSKCSANTKKMSLNTALEFVKKGKTPELQKRIVYAIQDKKEPYVFTKYFQGWQKTKGQECSIKGNILLAEEEYKKFFIKYSYDDLVNKKFPKGIDEQALETYLTDDEFAKVFNMSLDQFNTLPLWKRENLKKAKKLY
ncbi:hypothetical protein ENUP19_0079G0023 [Entamoeba nuttalli]|uniref:Villidin, putative n=2 Tax=Entamoeba nuttalli TaxID=412467 RepID=K2H7S7_ENTNP|nr:villidin, putative [Entamoeba nuttalli P19]EKE38579.1 villidin, putative [Entamoeba nuttalli P19]|eukprot:XP_008859082.1 villidin, putative [Entamoeba nuttalli P19]